MTDIVKSTLRPGLLVALKTSVSGNVKYNKEVIEDDHTLENGAREVRWETTRTIIDPIEYEAARKVRNTAGAHIRRICAVSSFGLLCPEADSDALEQAVKKARAEADAFNQTSSLTRVTVLVMTGRIAPDDVEAIKAINSEIKDLMETMADGLKNLDVKAVRDAAGRAKDIGQMLNTEAQTRVQMAIKQAREAATKIKAAGEQGAAEIDLVAIRKITELRASFLDLDDAAPMVTPTTPGVAVDLSPVTYDQTKATGNFNDPTNFVPASKIEV